ncbi:PIN domain-containing protein [Thermococcus henrietii]|uniref:PIN domain-containing protein n=1 Tax=Thermococcus henrietii TaxID=2016361 RepID=UPI0021D438F9|nr:PIN domain-containing protein [Thermococcus henrietii]
MDSLGVFVDTNVIIEHLAGNIDLLEIREKFNILYTNSIVFSEALMVYLRALTGKGRTHSSTIRNSSKAMNPNSGNF